jgi:hypothetical protein
MKSLLCCTLLLLIIPTSAFGQSAPTADPIKGVWKLNVDKSRPSSAGLESEIITIVAQDNSYKLTFDVKQSNDYNPKYEIATDMKGGTVKPVYADGSKTSDSWRVTRRGVNTFDMELMGGWTDKYEVSSDGKFMTLHRDMSKSKVVGGYIEKDGSLRRQPPYFLVFERME